MFPSPCPAVPWGVKVRLRRFGATRNESQRPETKAHPESRRLHPFEFAEGSSWKFWEVWVEGNYVVTKWGKIGTDGRETIWECKDATAAQTEMAKLIAEHTKKGYVEKSEQGEEDLDENDEDEEDEDEEEDE
jgi:predicted DNA-binding WGR domain protein